MADQYIQHMNAQLDQFDVQLRKNPYVHQAASSTGVRPSLIAGTLYVYTTCALLIWYYTII